MVTLSETRSGFQPTPVPDRSIRNGIWEGSSDAIVVSFCAGKKYYFDAATQLEARLDELGVEHDIVRMDIPEGSDWIDICKEKIRFYRDMLIKHQRPITWIDVDNVVLRRPDALLDTSADITCFLRSFKYIVGFDPDQFSRLIAPSYITFGFNQRVLDFLTHAVSLVDQSDLKATDDYFLQEALTTWGGDLRFMLLKPSDLALHSESDNANTAYFVHGHSGNVETFKGDATQHEAAALSIPRQKRVLLEGVRASLKLGDRDSAAAFYNRIRRLDPSDPDTLGKYLDFLRKSKQWKKLQYHINVNKAHPVLGAVVERVNFQAALDQKNWDSADKQYHMAQQQNSPHLPLMKSRMVRYDLDRRAENLGISDDDRVKMWWMETPYPGNFGDIINPYVIEGLTGIPPKFTHSAERLIAIGSIIKFAKKGTSVWGAGSPWAGQVLTPEAQYCAVRGPLTRDVVLRSGGHVDPVYGDAAWFLPNIYRPPVPKTHKLGIILHVVHSEAAPPIDPDVKIIDLRRVGRGEIESFIEDLLSCENVLSTSLHGVIMAHAYGIPVRWCVASGSSKQIHGDGMKFEDYFRSVGRHAPDPLDISSLESITSRQASSCVDNPESPIDLKQLAGVAPFTIKKDIVKNL